MSSAIYFSPLGAEDARAIARLQHRLFPRELREPVSDIRSILENTEKHIICNLTFGMFDGNKMVGYFFVYVESESLFHQREEKVVYIKEIAILPGYEGQLRRGFAKLFDLWSALTPGVPIEAHAVEASLSSWRRLVRIYRYFGISLSTKLGDNPPGEPEYHLLRLDVAPNSENRTARRASLPEPTFHLRDNGDDYSVAVVTEIRQWLSLEKMWNGLLEETPDWNVFQSFEYLWQWWTYCGIWNELCIVVVRKGDQIVGFVPLMVERFSVIGKPVRKLTFISTPMEMNRPKMIFGSDHANCLSVFLGWLQHSAGEWDILDIDEQLAGTNSEALVCRLRACRYLVAESETICPYIDCATGWESFVSGLSRKMRSNIRRARRRLESLGTVIVRRVSRWPDLAQAMEQHCELESRSWKAEKKQDLWSNTENYCFCYGLARSFGNAGEFELRTLEIDGKIVASTFGIRHKGDFQSLRIAHDRHFDQYSPGTALESYEIEELLNEGIQCYEFVGSFLANKLRWTSTVHKTTNIHAYQRQLRLTVFFYTFFVLKRRVKSILKRTGQFERVDGVLKKLGKNPFPRY